MSQLTKQQTTSHSKETIYDFLEEAEKQTYWERDKLNTFLNQSPPKNWVKTNKYANNSEYLPIDKVEFIIRKIFKVFKIEITGQGVAFNGVWVTIRLHYLDPITQEMIFHDGIGACELQTEKGKSAADLASINKNALAMAFPIAKSYAIKDASHHLGDIFGANLNRKDVLEFKPDAEPIGKEEQRIIKTISEAKNLEELKSIAQKVSVEKYGSYLQERTRQLTPLEARQIPGF